MIPSIFCKRCVTATLTMVLAFLSISSLVMVDAFIPAHTHNNPVQHHTTTNRPHNMAGSMDDLSNFFDGLGDNNNNESSRNAEIVEEIDGVYTGSKRIISIPAKTMKSGGLRLYCNLYLMGLQNTPEKGCWKASQSDNSEVNLRYTDLTGSIIIRFTEDAITVDRLGSAPSMKYLMHESMILNGFLDELHAIVNDGDISEDNRLLTLLDDNEIENARDAVSFG